MKKQMYLFVILLVLAIFPLMAFGPKYAPKYVSAPLPEGRTYDQYHSWGLIDWNSSYVYYEALYHEDWANLPPEEGGYSCLSGCTENVTFINNGHYITGKFDRDVTYFEVMLAYENRNTTGVGTATITACGSSRTQDLRANSIYPGFNSFPLTVPAGCRDWTVQASDGWVHFRSVDVNYLAVIPTFTHTFTPTNTPTSTHTFTPTMTGTLPPTNTFTSTPTSTHTYTPTSTGTPPATFTPTSTPSATSTGTLVSTRTPTATATAPVIPSSAAVQQSVVILVPNIIINNSNTNTNTTSGGGGSSGGSGFTAVTPAPMQGQGGITIWGGDVCGGYYVRVRVYVDDNQDGMMSPAEGITGLQVFQLDQTYARLGSEYSVDGQVAFCISSAQYGKPTYIDIPYLQQFATVQIPEQPDQDIEIWFPGEPPELPLYLP